MMRIVVVCAAIGFFGHAFGADGTTPGEEPKPEAPKQEDVKKADVKKDDAKKESPKKEGPKVVEEETPPPGTKPIISITKREVQYAGKTGRLKLILAGKVEKLPPGAKVTIELEYNYQVVGSCLATVGSDGTFGDTPLVPEKVLPPGDEYELVVKVLPEPQPASLRAAVTKIVDDEKNVIGTFQGKIMVGSPADQKLWREKAVKTVKGMLEELIGLNNELVDTQAKAEADAKAGAFDEPVWREFLDTKWRPSVIALQKRWADLLAENPSVETRFPKGTLCFDDMLALVALRSKLLSQAVYKIANKAATLQDTSPPAELRIQLRQVSSLKTDKKALQLLATYYKVVEEDFGLKPPDEGKAKKAPAKKEPAKKASAKPEPAKKDSTKPEPAKKDAEAKEPAKK